MLSWGQFYLSNIDSILQTEQLTYTQKIILWVIFPPLCCYAFLSPFLNFLLGLSLSLPLVRILRVVQQWTNDRSWTSLCIPFPWYSKVDSPPQTAKSCVYFSVLLLHPGNHMFLLCHLFCHTLSATWESRVLNQTVEYLKKWKLGSLLKIGCSEAWFVYQASEMTKFCQKDVKVYKTDFASHKNTIFCLMEESVVL